MNESRHVSPIGRTGLAHSRQTIDTKVFFGIVRGWIIGPSTGFILAYAVLQRMLNYLVEPSGRGYDEAVQDRCSAGDPGVTHEMAGVFDGMELGVIQGVSLELGADSD